MASIKTLKVSNRSPKRPIKKLPASVELSPNTTVEDVKHLIAKAAGISDHNRIGVFDPTTKKTLKDRRALINDIEGVAKEGEVLIKDLGPQMAWQTVFVLEYLGPLVMHPLVIAARPYIYKNGAQPMSDTQWLAFGMIMAHFFKREIETLFVHKFSANTMPIFNLFKNSGFYWGLAGLLPAYTIYHPSSLAGKATDSTAVNAAGALVYLLGEFANAAVHLYLSGLRSRGGTERKIPHGYGFALVTCPNYMYEIIAWAGMIIVSRDPIIVLFISIGALQMYFWAIGKEKAYRKEFGDKYKKKRYLILPGLV